MSITPDIPDPSPRDRQAEPQPRGAGHEINLLLAEDWNRPLWKDLLEQIRDRISPEKLPPLRLTSRPVDVGMLAGDVLSLPWYRSVFTNLGDVISPETQPPLQLESRPVDVGELISDQMSHGWWSSLLRNLADVVAPERQPALQLTSSPMDPGSPSRSMQLPRWSSVISTPKVFLPDKPKAEYQPAPVRVAQPKPKPDPAEIEFVRVMHEDLRRDLRRSRFRQRIWVGLVFVEFAAMIVGMFWWN